jgi:hypothetical protein
MAKTLQFRRGTTGELASITPANGEILIDTTLNTIKIGNNTVAGGKVINGLAGSSYIYVTGNGASSTVNGEELLAAYNLAKTMTPFGSGLYYQNRIAIVVAPGRYNVNFAPNGRWDIDTDYVDIISLTGERDVFIEDDINITANDVLIRGLYSTYDIYVGSNLSNLRMENCKAYNLAKGNVNLDADVNISGTFIDCEAQNAGFAGDSGGMASGTFINCIAGADSFGGADLGTASGVFTNCVAGEYGFGGYDQGGPNSGTLFGTLNYCRLTYGTFQTPIGGGKIHYSIDGNGKEVTSPGGGTSYVYVAGDKASFEANGQQLLDAYALAKTMTPYGDVKAVYNRVQVVVAPGTYWFPNDDFNIDTPYVDVVSLTGNRDVVLDFINVTSVATDVYLKGLDLGTNPFTIYGNRPNLKIENCAGGDYSFSGDSQSTKGTYINCTAGNYSFGGRDSINDIGSGYAESGVVFIDCTAGDYSFGGDLEGDGAADGTFINCVGGNYCFGSIGFSNGTFKDCTAGNYSFGGMGNVVGIYTNCNAGGYSFGGVAESSVSGTFTNCSAIINCFGGDGATVSGTFTNCIAISNCFGGNNSNISGGTFDNCKAFTWAFGGDGATVSGTFTNCIAENGYSFGGGTTGTFSGIANQCTAGASSFGQSGLTGKLYFCRLTSGTYPTPSSGGKIRFCLDGYDDPEDIGQYLA